MKAVAYIHAILFDFVTVLLRDDYIAEGGVMKYQVGQVGRVFLARFEDGEPILETLTKLIRRENVWAGVIYLLGGVTRGRIVVGPEQEKFPPSPEWRELAESHETLAIGTVFRHEGEPKIHLHGAFGKKDSVRVGCLRERADTFIVLEAIILELSGIRATRALDPLSQMILLNLDQPECDGL